MNQECAGFYNVNGQWVDCSPQDPMTTANNRTIEQRLAALEAKVTALSNDNRAHRYDSNGAFEAIKELQAKVAELNERREALK